MPATSTLRPLPSSPPARFARGFAAPFRGLARIARTRALWPYVVVPVLITAALLVGALVATFAWGGALTDALVAAPRGTGWGAALGRGAWRLAEVFVHLALLAALGIAAWFLGSALASPFHDRLSDRVEHLEGRGVSEPFRVGQVVHDLFVGAAHTLLFLLAWLAVTVFLLPLHVLPGVGSVLHATLSGTFGALALAREAMEPCTSRRRWSLAAKVRLVVSEPALMLGLGAGGLLLLSVPGLDLLVLPATTVGGTLLFLELGADRPERASAARQP